MITANDFVTIGLPVSSSDPETVLKVNSAFEWLSDNTTLEINLEDVQGLASLPASVKMFVLKYVDVMSLATGITSEGLDTLNHSFESNKSGLIWNYARELIGKYLKSQVTFTLAKRKW